MTLATLFALGKWRGVATLYPCIGFRACLRFLLVYVRGMGANSDGDGRLRLFIPVGAVRVAVNPVTNKIYVIAAPPVGVGSALLRLREHSLEPARRQTCGRRSHRLRSLQPA